MTPAQRYRATYEFKPLDHLVRREFYIWSEALDLWQTQGMPPEGDKRTLFGYDETEGFTPVGMLGWTEPAFVPAIEEKVLETAGDYDVICDSAGRTMKVFKGKRHGFMPTYLKHAVTGERDWQEDIAPLLDPSTPARWAGFDETIAAIKADRARGQFITQWCIGGYMYLRSLLGPEEVCYMFMDNPGLIHKMMQAWLALADAVTARVQQHVELDELFLGEDICYNHGLLISPDMVRRFLAPYYGQLLAGIRRRQARNLHFQIDTDGNVNEAIDLYVQMGMDVMSPFEIAAGNDLLDIARRHPGLVMQGGIDKRVLAAGKDAIDEYLRRVIPFMVRRGGYIPTCDHGVPDNVSFDSYLHYRRRMIELDH